MFIASRRNQYSAVARVCNIGVGKQQGISMKEPGSNPIIKGHPDG
jgi:hypothetical protein